MLATMFSAIAASVAFLAVLPATQAQGGASGGPDDYFIWPPPQSPGSPTIVWDVGSTYNISWHTVFPTMSLQIVSAYIDGSNNQKEYTLLNGTDSAKQNGTYNYRVPSNIDNGGSNFWNVLILNGSLIPINNTIFTYNIPKFQSGQLIINNTVVTTTSQSGGPIATATGSPSIGPVIATQIITLTSLGDPVNTATGVPSPSSTPAPASGDGGSGGLSHDATVGIGVGVGVGVPLIAAVVGFLIWNSRRNRSHRGSGGPGAATGSSAYGINYRDEAAAQDEASAGQEVRQVKR